MTYKHNVLIYIISICLPGELEGLSKCIIGDYLKNYNVYDIEPFNIKIYLNP